MGERTYPAPLGGWNARDSLADMDPADAVEMVNLVPDTGAVRPRGGKIAFCSIGGSEVSTLVSYAADDVVALLACGGGKIYDVTSGTAVTLKSGLSEDAWQYEHFNNKVVLCNGSDHEQVYDGSTLTDLTITSGPTLGTLIGVVAFKGRAFYWEAHALKLWYAAAGAYQGVLTELSLEYVAQTGGFVKYCCTWTRAGGDGMNDLLVVVLSTGEIIVYQGDDPGDATRWSLVGNYRMGAPLSIRAHAKLASTQILVTSDGILAMEEAVNNQRVQSKHTFGGKIVNAVQRAAQAYSGNFGWDVVFYPRGNLLLINVPLSSTTNEQYVRNTNTGAWCRFTNWNAASFAIYQDKLYYGNHSGTIYEADAGTSDDGAYLDCHCITAYRRLGAPGLKTRLTAVSHTTTNKYPVTVSVKAFADFRVRELPPVVSPDEQTPATWDTSAWDTDYWASPYNDPSNQDARSALKSVDATGFMIALVVRFKTKFQIPLWYSDTMIFDQAGVR